ncbi:hypothetical protein IU500_15920 [Nocardia terpenica]|nr:hypothetical protein [Nocardia terpenica]MBF6061241.1 hypothetical protein [Nocardia terpenica]MBF6105530.1 hypothetical protein [Nocardia terpenica]MBF6113000.1 hypothetical protein [Nocardia terpenica]MBF6119130.1 hypothetical protein [Nocardia terpenica]MBF6152778.1 hypothetical protein [Nocardia terpenica]
MDDQHKARRARFIQFDGGFLELESTCDTDGSASEGHVVFELDDGP